MSGYTAYSKNCTSYASENAFDKATFKSARVITSLPAMFGCVLRKIARSRSVIEVILRSHIKNSVNCCLETLPYCVISLMNKQSKTKSRSVNPLTHKCFAILFVTSIAILAVWPIWSCNNDASYD